MAHISVSDGHSQKRFIVYFQQYTDAWSTAHTEVTFTSSSVLLVNTANAHYQLELIAKSAWGNLSPISKCGFLSKWLNFTCENLLHNGKSDQIWCMKCVNLQSDWHNKTKHNDEPKIHVWGTKYSFYWNNLPKQPTSTDKLLFTCDYLHDISFLPIFEEFLYKFSNILPKLTKNQCVNLISTLLCNFSPLWILISDQFWITLEMSCHLMNNCSCNQ